jgi:hypothetical protein
MAGITEQPERVQVRPAPEWTPERIAAERAGSLREQRALERDRRKRFASRVSAFLAAKPRGSR